MPLSDAIKRMQIDLAAEQTNASEDRNLETLLITNVQFRGNLGPRLLRRRISRLRLRAHQNAAPQDGRSEAGRLPLLRDTD